jgi:hypothetical protein
MVLVAVTFYRKTSIVITLYNDIDAIPARTHLGHRLISSFHELVKDRQLKS